MPVIVYIANQFPSAVEPYVVEEINEVRRRGAEVIPVSGKRVGMPGLSADLKNIADATIFLYPPRPRQLLQALTLCSRRRKMLKDILKRVLARGNEPLFRRLRALLHTLLGAHLSRLLENRGVQHIHAHHGYFASWIAMVAARLLGIPWSMTLHGSDLLQNGAYLDIKLEDCRFCLTISEYNRQFIRHRYPQINPEKIMLQPLGVDAPQAVAQAQPEAIECMVLLAVGRLHRVKNHAFLLHACSVLKKLNMNYLCLIAGDGPERKALQELVGQLDLRAEVKLLGHVPREQLDFYYRASDLVVLTSHSEGIPLALMEAMGHGKIVLAPAITGIPELVVEGKTGFLYSPNNLSDFIHQVETIKNSFARLQKIRSAARDHVLANFNREKNLEKRADIFLKQLTEPMDPYGDENPVLQQI